MNDQNSRLDLAARLEYNNLLKPFYQDLLNLGQKYPHILSRLIDLSEDKAAMLQYLKQILLDSRDGKRKGFDPNSAALLINIFTKYSPMPLFIYRDYEQKF